MGENHVTARIKFIGKLLGICVNCFILKYIFVVDSFFENFSEIVSGFFLEFFLDTCEIDHFLAFFNHSIVKTLPAKVTALVGNDLISNAPIPRYIHTNPSFR